MLPHHLKFECDTYQPGLQEGHVLGMVTGGPTARREGLNSGQPRDPESDLNVNSTRSIANLRSGNQQYMSVAKLR